MLCNVCVWGGRGGSSNLFFSWIDPVTFMQSMSPAIELQLLPLFTWKPRIPNHMMANISQGTLAGVSWGVSAIFHGAVTVDSIHGSMAPS